MEILFLNIYNSLFFSLSFKKIWYEKFNLGNFAGVRIGSRLYSTCHSWLSGVLHDPSYTFQ